MEQGCLIVNLGSPDGTTPADIRRFLHTMLSDKCVVNLPRFLWQPILQGIVLRRRSQRLVEHYEGIWTPEGSPLAAITRKQAEALGRALPDVEVRYAFCYSSPTIEEVLEGWDVDHLTVIPLYPQFAQSTVTPIVFRVRHFWHDQDHPPHLVFASAYATEQNMVTWYQQRIQECLTQGPVDQVLLSFHGVPEWRYYQSGYYRAQCLATRTAIAAAFPDVSIEMSFQSKFSLGSWLQPATADVIAELPSKNVKNLVVATPAFVADCLETLVEIREENCELFLDAGGESFRVISPINDDLAFIATLVNVFQAATATSPRA